MTTPPVAGTNLLVNGSGSSHPLLTALDTGRWGAFSSVAGWSAISGGTIELWNNLNGVQATDGKNYGELDYKEARDGFYQDVKTVAGQSYDLSFDARSRPGFTGSTCSVEVLWNGSVVGTVPPGSSWENYDFTVVGTGGKDRLTVREVGGQGSDGLGALYDNFALTAKPTSAASATTLASADHSISLLLSNTPRQSLPTNPGLASTSVTGTPTNNITDQTLALPHWNPFQHSEVKQKGAAAAPPLSLFRTELIECDRFSVRLAAHLARKPG